MWFYISDESDLTHIEMSEFKAAENNTGSINKMSGPQKDVHSENSGLNQSDASGSDHASTYFVEKVPIPRSDEEV